MSRRGLASATLELGQSMTERSASGHGPQRPLCDAATRRSCRAFATGQIRRTAEPEVVNDSSVELPTRREYPRLATFFFFSPEELNPSGRVG